ncbi:MAG: carboxylating nicotinate-nucleotide diphosphorylase [Planctomycetota bacterium]
MKDGPIDDKTLAALVKRALDEDLGKSDLTTEALVAEGAAGRAEIRAKAVGVLAGQFVAEAVFAHLGVEWEIARPDGARVEPGTVVGRARGDLRALLTGERAALNFLAGLSGVATLTSKFVDAVAGTKARILDTRKTTPGFRNLEKYAVRMGGGTNHRMGLDHQVLVKENHIAAAKISGAATGFDGAVRLLAANLPEGTVVGIEVQDLGELHIALEVAPDFILCDNFSVEDLALAVSIRNGWPGDAHPELEASGGVDLSTVATVAATGVERISVGALTHSAPALDLSMGIEA